MVLYESLYIEEIIIQSTSYNLTIMAPFKMYVREWKSLNNSENYELSDALSNYMNVKL